MQNLQKEQLEKRLIEKAVKDEKFRQLLLEDPRVAIENELGMKIPAGMKIHVVEEKPGEVYLVLPREQSAETQEELTEAELNSVAGGITASMDFETQWTYCC
ncbi:MAG: NHLP leader peptide family RiPP precursor [bacterium]